MSPEFHRNKIQAAQRKIVQLQNEKVRESKKITSAQTRIASASQAINRSNSSSTIKSKLKEMVLLDQPFIRDSSMTIEDLVKKNISTLGENIQIRRFERFVLGEGLEKKNENFSDEVEKMIKK